MPAKVIVRRRQEAFEVLWQRYVAELGAPSSAAAGLLLLEIIHEDNRYFHPKRWSVHQHADSNVELVNKLLDADDARFYTLTRMTKACSHYVLSRIETHSVFQGAEMGPRRRIGVQMQLFVFCYSLGRCLDTLASSVIANLSHGTAHAIMGRVSKAIIMTLEAEEVQWPNGRDEILDEMWSDLVYCIGKYFIMAKVANTSLRRMASGVSYIGPPPVPLV